MLTTDEVWMERNANAFAIVTALLLGASVLSGQAPNGAATRAAAAEPPAWVLPLTRVPVSNDSVTPRHVPGSTATYTSAQASNRFDIPDWFPASHPKMPDVVAHGRAPDIIACGYCHLPDGAGRPENASLAGLPASYIERQAKAFRTGTRGTPWHEPNKPADVMGAVAESATPSEVKAAAKYFSKIAPRQRAKVIEAERIPRVQPALGLYFRAADGGEETLGDRLIEVAADQERHELRDPSVEYVAYVPPGSIARGKVLASRGIAPTVKACSSCHGDQLRGAGPVPPIAGRSPSYLLRQLIGFAAGTRSSQDAAPMREVAGALTLNDMIAAAAYAASLSPSSRR